MPTHFHLRGTGTDLGDEVTYRYMSEAVIDQLQFDYPASCEVVPCACAGGEFVLDHEERGERAVSYTHLTLPTNREV